MKKSKLGNSRLEITKVGLGTWAIGGPWQFGWGRQDDNDSMDAIVESLDAGVNWLDTAPIYGCGHSETIIGKVLKKIGQKPIIATKCGLIWNDKKEKISCLKAKSILAECDASLKRLGVETIDLYQMHWNQPDEDIEEGFEAMAKCVKAGKVRYLGVSNFTVEQIERVMKIHPLTSLQPPYSMFRRDIENDILPFCEKNNIGVIVYSPLQKGLLSGKFTPAKVAALPADDVRHNDTNFKPPLLEKNLKVIDRLADVAKRNRITVAQLAIGWTLRDSAVTAAIVGARRKGQISETAPAADVKLSNDDINEIEEILKERKK
ncbi:MAG TPA: aldo/keto reductase [Phycisphaerales bacterium]|nr:MAG: aldo/keto reductase [Planctomycetes bacterium GWC2_45_44]HBG77473.1 aldo/keto reductase [Phycisphaerales bacterium]HBR20935.1 aldo/keto reductase [Phycisphaerales bacterium]